MMDSSGYLEACCPWLGTLSVSVSFQELFLNDVYFSTADGMNLLQSFRGLHRESPTGARHKIYIALFPTLESSSTIEFVGSYGPSS